MNASSAAASPRVSFPISLRRSPGLPCARALALGLTGMCAVTLTALPLRALASTTTWTDAKANGNGCPPGTSVVTIAGDEIAWVFDAFAFDGNASLSCKLIAKAQIVRGWYLARFDQVFSYGGVKSTSGSALEVSATTRFFGFNLPVIRQAYPDGTPFDSPYTELDASIPFGVYSPPANWCRGQGNNGLLQSTLAAKGQANANAGGMLSFAGQGFNVKFSATGVFGRCER